MGRRKHNPAAPAGPPGAGPVPAAFALLFAGWCAWLLAKTYAGSGPVLAQGLSFFALPRYAGAARRASREPGPGRAPAGGRLYGPRARALE